MEPKWKIKDLVVPLREEDDEAPEKEQHPVETPVRVAVRTSEEERKVRVGLELADRSPALIGVWMLRQYRTEGGVR